MSTPIPSSAPPAPLTAAACTLAKYNAVKAVKAELAAQGQRHVPLAAINSAARIYLQTHPELIEEATETVSRREAERKSKLVHKITDAEMPGFIQCERYERK
jgi:hypothetical protein